MQLGAIFDVTEAIFDAIGGYFELNSVGRQLVLRAYAKAIWLVAIIVFPFATEHTIIANMNSE